MTDNVVTLDDERPHEFFEAMCVKCYRRWIAVMMVGVLLKDIECPTCGASYVIRTGQPVDD